MEIVSTLAYFVNTTSLTMCEKYLLLLVYVSFLRSFCECQGGPPPPPPPPEDTYVVNFDSPIYACDDELSQAFLDPSEMEAERVNETTAVLYGVVHFLKGVGPGTMVELKIEKSNQGRLDPMFSLEICDFCDELQKLDSPFVNYFQAFGFPTECPFDAGDYHVKDLIADMSDLPINSVNQGRFKATLTVNKDTDDSCKNLEFIACVAFEFLIERQ